MLEKLKKSLTREMTWPRLLIISVASAVVVAVLNCIPALENTSFTVPAETTEVWVVLAVYIIMNCKGYKDAVIKTFVFFLVSQPLIYLIEVPFKEAGWGLFSYYGFWAFITVLTIPGSAIAYRVKKGDWISALILSVANGMMIIGILYRVQTLIYEFPRYLLMFIFCFITPIIFNLLLLKDKKSKIIAFALVVVSIGIGLWKFLLFPTDFKTSYPLDEPGNWTVETEPEDGLTVVVDGEDSLDLASHRNGDYSFVIVSDEGERIKFDVNVSGGDHVINITGHTELD